MMVRGVAGPGAGATLSAGAYTRVLRAHPAARIPPVVMCAAQHDQSRTRHKGREGNFEYRAAAVEGWLGMGAGFET